MIRSYVTQIHNEFGQLLEKMPWINTLKQPIHKAVPKFLHEILEFQGHCLEVLSKEDELRRKLAPPDTPVSIPKSNFKLRIKNLIWKRIQPWSIIIYWKTTINWNLIEKELTLEEEAALNRPELSEKDLPEDEMSNYIRSPKEVAVLTRWMNETKSKSSP